MKKIETKVNNIDDLFVLMKKRVLKLYPADNEMMTMFTNLQLCKLIIDEPTLVPDLPIVESSLSMFNLFEIHKDAVIGKEPTNIIHQDG